HRLTDSTFKVDAFLEVLFDQVSNDLSIGFGDKSMILFSQFVFELQIIFDDPIVDNDHVTRAITMRMCVFLRRTSMRCPTRVPEAISPIEWFLSQGLFKIAQLALRAAN